MPGAIASLNPTVTFDVTATAVAAGAGIRWTIVGAVVSGRRAATKTTSTR